MGCQLYRNFIAVNLLIFLVLHVFSTEALPISTLTSTEEDIAVNDDLLEISDCSTDKTIEIVDVSSSDTRRKRSPLESLDDSVSDMPTPNVAAGQTGMQGRAGPFGLPDPATVIKVAEILQTVGDKVVPVLLEGNPAIDAIVESVDSDFKFLRNFKKQIDDFVAKLMPNAISINF